MAVFRETGNRKLVWTRSRVLSEKLIVRNEYDLNPELFLKNLGRWKCMRTRSKVLSEKLLKLENGCGLDEWLRLFLHFVKVKITIFRTFPERHFLWKHSESSLHRILKFRYSMQVNITPISIIKKQNSNLEFEFRSAWNSPSTWFWYFFLVYGSSQDSS